MARKFHFYWVMILFTVLIPTLLFFLTPTPANAAGETVYVYQDITTNTTWNAGNTYVICEVPSTGRGPAVMPGVTLTIESGTTVLLDDNRIFIGGGIDTYTHGTFYVYGNINATGTTFTARDDKWGSIILKANSIANLTVNATFTNCIFEKGANGEPTGMIMVQENVNLDPADGQTVNLTVSGSTFCNSITNSAGSGIPGMGVYATIGHHTNAAGTFSFSNTTFDNLGCAILVMRNGQDNIDVSIEGCTFSNLSYGAGVSVEDCRNVTVTDSSFTNIGEPAGTGTPLLVGYNYASSDYWGGYAKGNVTVTGNTFTGDSGTTAFPMQFHAAAKINTGIASPGNVFPGYPDAAKYAGVFLGVRYADAIWGKTGLPYLLGTRTDVGVITGSGVGTGSLTIEPGNTVTMRSGGWFKVLTALIANGTAEMPIRFQAIAPKTEWNRIDITSASKEITLRYCVLDGMEYGLYGEGNYGSDGLDSLTVEHCTFANMTKSGMVFVNYGSVADGQGVVKDTVFENNGEHGFRAVSGPNRLVLSNCIFRNNAKDGISLLQVTHMTFDHCLIYSNGQNGVALQDNTDAANAPSLIHCTIAKNGWYGVVNRDVDAPYAVYVQGMTMRNTISSGNEVEDLYNQGYVEWTGSRITYSCITTSWSDYNDTISAIGTGSIRKDALFADPGNQDFHLKSDGGRWNGSGWTTDTATSQCIDAGDPASSYANEATPNGGRINMGYYGNTAEASKARVGALDTTDPVWAEGAELTASDITPTAATLRWSEVGDAVGYRVMKDEGGYGYGEWATVKTLTGRSCSISGDFDWGYLYKVEAMDAAGNWSTTGPICYVRTPDFVPPVWENGSLTASNITATGVKLNWSGAYDEKDGNAYKCRIYQNGTLLVEVYYYARTYTVTGLSPSTNYTFKVEASDSSLNWTTDGPSRTITTSADASTCTVTFDSQGGSAVDSQQVDYNGLVTKPTNPTWTGHTFAGWYKQAACTSAWNFTTDRVTANTTLFAKWTTNVPTSYAVAVSANNGAWGTVSGGGNYAAGATATVKATPKAGYRFVRWLEGSTAVSTNASYAFPVTKARTLKAEFAAIATPALTVKTTTTTGATLSWTAVAGATGYEVYRDGVRVDLVTGTTYTAKGLSVGKAYLYKIRARCAATTATTYSAYSTTVVVRPLPAAPAGVKAASTGYNSAKVSWNAVTGATKYQVYRATSASGSYTYLGETAATNYTNTGLTTGKTYSYKVRAYSMVGTVKVTGAYSAVVSAKPVPATPTGVAATRVSNSSLKVSWSKVSGATGYQVYRATSKTGTYSKIKETTSLSYTNKSLTDNKTYYYKVRAYRTVSTTKVYGAYSAVASARP